MFKLLQEKMKDGQKLSMTIMKKSGMLTMSIYPDVNQSGELGDITPMTLTGTAEDFEKDFGKIFEPVEKAFDLAQRVKEYTERVARAEEKTKMAKEKKAKEDEQRKNFEQALEKARKLAKEKKFADARTVLGKTLMKNEEKTKMARAEGMRKVNRQGVEKRQAAARNNAANVAAIAAIKEMHNVTSYAEIAAALNSAGMLTRHGCKWFPMSVSRLIKLFDIMPSIRWS